MNFPDILSTICDTRLPIPLSAFGIDSTLPFKMAGHLFRHSTSSIGTTTPPNIFDWANCKIIEDAGMRQDKINFILWI